METASSCTSQKIRRELSNEETIVRDAFLASWHKYVRTSLLARNRVLPKGQFDFWLESLGLASGQWACPCPTWCQQPPACSSLRQAGRRGRAGRRGACCSCMVNATMPGMQWLLFSDQMLRQDGPPKEIQELTLNPHDPLCKDLFEGGAVTRGRPVKKEVM